MDKNSEKLIEKFKEIAEKGWIKGISTSWGNNGLTFEHELGKAPDSKYKPDFKDIEIKCASRYSRYPMFLFTIAFDGPNENEIQRITNKYGYSDPDFPTQKVIFRKIDNEINKENKYSFIFDIDKIRRKIFLCIFDSDGNLIERESYVKFSSIKKHLYTKLKKMAYVKASKKKIGEINYYRYYSIYLYYLKDFKTFLELIKNGELEITLISRISKSGEDKGRYRNKNIEYAIKKENINMLFECYAQFNHDIFY